MNTNVKIRKSNSLFACVALVAGQLFYNPGAAAEETSPTPCMTNTPPRFNCGPNQTAAEDSGPQTVPNWATGIQPHSIVRVPVVFATDFTLLPPGTRILDPNGTNLPNPRVEGGVLHLTDAGDPGGFGGWAIGPFPTQTFESLQASWRSLVGGGGGGGADGYSLNLGTDLEDLFSGEEGTGTGLNVTIDTFDNGTEPFDIGLEINWRGSRVAALGVPKDDDGSGNFIRKSQFVSASLSVSPAGLATFNYDGNVLNASLANYTGVAVNQVNFGARTGNANDNHWIDDLSLTGFPFDGSSAEANQTVSFNVSNDNPSLFTAQPAISPNGTLTYTPAPNSCGVANVTVVARDDGGTACGDDTSDPCTRTITIAPLNDCPAVAPVPPLTTGPGQPVTFTLDATDPDQGCVPQTLTAGIVAPPAHGTVSANGLSVTYTPNPGYLGPDSFQLAVSDGQCASAPVTVNATVAIINEPPVCMVGLAAGSCILTLPNDPNQYALALDNSQVCLQFDASGSSDPDGDPLTYSWTVDGAPVDPGTAVGPLLTACLEVGCHTVTVNVSDGQVASACSVSVCVITAGETVHHCIDLVDNMNLGRKNKRPLLASLKAAAAAFDRGSFGAGMNQLNAFQNKIRAQVAPSNPGGAAELTDCVERILSAIECTMLAEAQGP